MFDYYKSQNNWEIGRSAVDFFQSLREEGVRLYGIDTMTLEEVKEVVPSLKDLTEYEKSRSENMLDLLKG